MSTLTDVIQHPQKAAAEIERLADLVHQEHERVVALEQERDRLRAALVKMAFEDCGGMTFFFMTCRQCGGRGTKNTLDVSTVRHAVDCLVGAALGAVREGK